MSGLCASIARLSRGVFGGVLIFVASYSQLKLLTDYLLNSSRGRHWKAAITDSKAVFVEPKKAAELPLLLQQFKQQIDKDAAAAADPTKQHATSLTDTKQTTGAILLGVCKGKIAEGQAQLPLPRCCY